MEHLREHLATTLTQARPGNRLYICTWYRKGFPEMMTTSYENAKNESEIRGRMRRSGRKLVSCKRDITYEFGTY